MKFATVVMAVVVAFLVVRGGQWEWEYGKAAHYAPGLFQRVAANRGLPTTLGCYVSTPRHNIGEWLLVEGLRTGAREWCLVADTSAPEDRARHLATRLYELDYESAQGVCGKWWRDRSDECPVKVLALGRSNTPARLP